MPAHTKAAGRAVRKQNVENLRAAASKVREIASIPQGLANGQVMRRKRGDASDESTIDLICTLVSNGATVVDALNEAKLDRECWYRWRRENHFDANNKYQEAALCYLELMADRTLKVFEDLEAKREAAKQTLRDRMTIYYAAQDRHEKDLRKWRGQDPEARGEAPMYEGPREPKYDGPEEWELSSAKEKAAMWKFHLQAGLERFKKSETVTHNVQTSILHTIDVKNIDPEKALATYHRLIEGKLEK